MWEERELCYIFQYLFCSHVHTCSVSLSYVTPHAHLKLSLNSLIPQPTVLYPFLQVMHHLTYVDGIKHTQRPAYEEPTPPDSSN